LAKPPTNQPVSHTGTIQFYSGTGNPRLNRFKIRNAAITITFFFLPHGAFVNTNGQNEILLVAMVRVDH